jgi:hypothetical protein
MVRPRLLLSCSSLLVVWASGCENLPTLPPDPKVAANVATIEGLAQIGPLFSPGTTLGFPGLIDFRAIEVDGESRKTFSGAIFTVPPGKHSLTVRIETNYSAASTCVLDFQAEASKVYLLRPLNSPSGIGALLADKETQKIVARFPPENPPAAFSVAPGGASMSMADDVLLHDVLTRLAKIEANGHHAVAIELTGVEYLGGRTVDEMKKGVHPGRPTVELWHLLCDGTRGSSYRVRFTPAKDGGTDFAIFWAR